MEGGPRRLGGERDRLTRAAGRERVAEQVEAVLHAARRALEEGEGRPAGGRRVLAAVRPAGIPLPVVESQRVGLAGREVSERDCLRIAGVGERVEQRAERPCHGGLIVEQAKREARSSEAGARRIESRARPLEGDAVDRKGIAADVDGADIRLVCREADARVEIAGAQVDLREHAVGRAGR